HAGHGQAYHHQNTGGFLLDEEQAQARCREEQKADVQNPGRVLHAHHDTSTDQASHGNAHYHRGNEQTDVTRAKAEASLQQQGHVDKQGKHDATQGQRQQEHNVQATVCEQLHGQHGIGYALFPVIQGQKSQKRDGAADCRQRQSVTTNRKFGKKLQAGQADGNQYCAQPVDTHFFELYLTDVRQKTPHQTQTDQAQRKVD